VLVATDQISSFVDYTTNFYSSAGYDDVASSVSQGIFAVNESTFDIYTVVKPDPLGENDFILPIIQVVDPKKNIGALMFNIYSGTERIPLLDSIYSCIRDLDGTSQDASFGLDDIAEMCMVVTKVIKVVEDVVFRPAVVMLYPVMLEVENISAVSDDVINGRLTVTVNGKTYVHVGSASAIFHWDRMLTKSVSQETHGLDIVLNDGSNDYFYTFEDGVAVYRPDRSRMPLTRLHMSFPITSLANSDFVYELHVQVDSVFSKRYYNDGPIFACALYVGAIIFCIIQYKLYDIQITKKWAQNDQAKRNFVRYISHEIRTPLTTVSLGIRLLLRQLGSLGLLSNSSGKVSSPLPRPHQSPSSDVLLSPILSSDAKDENKGNGGVMLSRTLSRSNSRVAMRDDEVVKDSLEVLTSVEGSVQVAVLILNDLLNYDKIQNGSLEISREYLDASKLVNEVCVSFQVAAQSALINLVVKASPFDLDSRRISGSGKQWGLGISGTALGSGGGSFSKDSSTGSRGKINVDDEMGDSSFTANKYLQADEDEHGSFKEISSFPQGKPLILYGDRLKLHQVLRNLISNAIKFTPEGGLITVTGSWAPNNSVNSSFKKSTSGSHESDEYVPSGTFIVTVEDNGVGVSAENLKAVFSDGWQFKANMLQGGQGSGLGLWITKNIVHLHHGKLTCHSAGLGCGCTMRLELPVLTRRDDVRNLDMHEISQLSVAEITENKINDAENEDALNAVSDYDVEQLAGEGKCVLLVDDSTMCRKMVCRLLSSLSYECIEAKNGSECIDIITGENGDKIDFILLDFEMPIMDGPTACKILREKGYTLPVVGLTGNVLKIDTDRFLACGANAVIAKPFSLEDFLKAIKVY